MIKAVIFDRDGVLLDSECTKHPDFEGALQVVDSADKVDLSGVIG